MSKTICDMELDTMSTEELKTVLKNELSQASKNYERIYGILEVLRIRKPKIKRAVPHAVTQQEIDSALLICQEADTPSQPEPKPLWRRKPTAAVAAILCILLIAIPAASGMPFIQQMMAKWNDEFLWIDAPGTPVDSSEDYVFQTDNPGLQQLYDTVTESGITAPVVPMWLPEGFCLSFLHKTVSENAMKIIGIYDSEEANVVFLLEKNDKDVSFSRHKTADEPEKWCLNEITHIFASNMNYHYVMWNYEDFEITIISTLNKQTLYNVIESIYGGIGVNEKILS